MKYIRTVNEFINLEKCRSIYYHTNIATYGKYRLYFEWEKGSSFLEYDDVEQLKRDVELIEEFITSEERLLKL